MMACAQKQQAVVTVPPSQIDVEKLLDSIDYDMDVSGLSLADVRTLRNAPAAQRGFPFKDSYIRDIYLTTSWYDSLMWVFDENMPYDKFESKEDESFYDFYYRMIDEANIMKYTDQEKAFIKRMQEREDELKQKNFEVGPGQKVNIQNMVNPTQLKDFDPLLSQQLGKDGFGIVPSRMNQLFQIYDKNDYNDFPNFVTTDLYLQIFHLYIDCMLREVEEQKLLPLMTTFPLSNSKPAAPVRFCSIQPKPLKVWLTGSYSSARKVCPMPRGCSQPPPSNTLPDFSTTENPKS
jgi:hypothetical protein